MSANINNVFWTIQGEGANWGRRALFVRMPFCNLACSWCDTSFNTFTKWTEEEFKNFAQAEPGRFAVLTGGEPSMNKHSPTVIQWLKDLGFEIAIESNGTFPIPYGIDFITVSPKRDADYDVHPDNWSRVNEFKYVVDEGFDFKILDRHKERQTSARLTLSPEFGKFKESIEQITNYIKENPEWRISLQTHKWMNIP
jgi:7-carboxy-7-deazaguanine synthase